MRVMRDTLRAGCTGMQRGAMFRPIKSAKSRREESVILWEKNKNMARMGHPTLSIPIYTQPRIFYKNKQGTCKNAYKLLLSLYSVLISIPYHMYILPRRRSTSYYTPEIASCQVKNARNVIFF